ncbi:phosphopantetheine-binding protein [Xiashengella succiniciproducens]|jgi:acyl carrier protein|uniref:Phosphopantetheine-binding protein n=1 Tax=Xiashengella succiniciproducens TaxID=2949635 RepID=A0A9J6ZPB2_9BACT|nr:phosphopantetheine-binding protein [Alkaliflexus sp. Ai-910]MDI9539251.1 phosphopantetheine-binding protein [Bacteroidota bacterium]URW79366.1 phosphopantetheine-binding protein [Alkaliflexus sp. Ai-910]HHU00116.1 acyl carrier protein [Bacteroidales bacterium]
MDLREKLKGELIEQLNLEDITPADIDSSAPLFGEGLGLDSIDALEIIVLLEKEYGIKISNPADGKDAMQSIDSLAAFIEKNRK